MWGKKIKPPMTPEQATQAIRKAVAEGRVEFANPLAKDMFPLTGEEFDDAPAGFSYVQAEALRPRHARFSKRNHDGGMYFQWGKKGFGFGEASIIMKDGIWHADTEHLGKQFLKDLLCAWVDQMPDEKPWPKKE